MAFIEPIPISAPKEQKWVSEISEILSDELKINLEAPSVSIFQVPETITIKKPEAYEPQHIGLGPIHHFRPGPYEKMEQKKLTIVRKVLRDYKIEDHKLIVLNKVRKIVPIIRSCYDMFLHGYDHESLAMIFAIDGLFLLNMFHTYSSEMDNIKEDYLVFLKNKAYEVKQFTETRRKYKSMHENNIEDTVPLLLQKDIVVTAENQTQWERILGVDPNHEVELPKVGKRKRLLAQDMLMVENQIPFIMLKEIDEALHSSLGNSSISSNNFSPSIFQTFCDIYSPLKLCSESKAPTSVQHLLHYMYYSIVNNVEIQEFAIELQSAEPRKRKIVDCFSIFDLSNLRRSNKSSVMEVYNLVAKIPREEIVQAYEQTISILETFVQSKSLIPSASTLHNNAGFEFYSLKKYQGIQNIGIRGKDMYLPCINLNNDSEVILRNLVAFETITATSDSFPLTEYMSLMCALILTVDDVKLLRSRNVITGGLGDDEVTKLFTQISSSIPSMKTKDKSNLQVMIDEVNKVYESRMTMKAYLLLKKLARWLLTALRAIGGFAESSWKIVAFMASFVTIFMLTSQAYCDVYGCDKTTVTMLPNASS